jgi:hypothetical protein
MQDAVMSENWAARKFLADLAVGGGFESRISAGAGGGGNVPTGDQPRAGILIPGRANVILSMRRMDQA